MPAGEELWLFVLDKSRHITSIAWLGFAAILVVLAQPTFQVSSVARVVSATFLMSAAVSFVGGRGRHYSWIVFLAIGLLSWFSSS